MYIYENLSNNFTNEIITLLAINFVSKAKLFPFTKRPFERLEIGQGGIYARRAKERILRLPLLNIFRIISAFAHQTSWLIDCQCHWLIADGRRAEAHEYNNKRRLLFISLRNYWGIKSVCSSFPAELYSCDFPVFIGCL